MFKNIIKLSEPLRGQKLLIRLNDIVNKNDLLAKLIPFAADIFVFSYPVYLLVLYLYWIFKKNVKYKLAAIYIFFSWVLSVLVNIFIQYFIDKQRPEQIVLSQKNLIFEHVPDKPFPSDHAAISAAIAMSTLLWWIKYKKKWMIYLSIMFWLFSIIMSFSRIGAGVHWPTDIVVWTLIWIIVSRILISRWFFNFCNNKFYKHLISLEKRLFLKIFRIKQ